MVSRSSKKGNYEFIGFDGKTFLARFQVNFEESTCDMVNQY
jgi:hypothetical protein